ncbi:MAG: AraC family transcriptional regulator [Turicibacter sp.]|nr:AraC family transcriptional regulator [Turicibacter sp.]
MKFKHETVNIASDIGVKFEHQYFDSNIVNQHWHNSLEIVYIVEGEFDVIMNRQTFTVSEGELIVVNSKQIHSSITRHPNQAILLQIPYQLLEIKVNNIEKLYFDCTPNTILNDEQRYFLNLMKSHLLDFSKLYSHKVNGYNLKANSIIFDLLFILVSQFGHYSTHRNNSQTDKYFDRLDVIIKYIKEHYTESIDLNTVSNLVGLNPEYFSRFFKKYMGVTFLKYLNSIRLEHVHQELLNTDYNISDIIEHNGFTNYKIFMALFKETYHCTPSELRKSLQIRSE